MVRCLAPLSLMPFKSGSRFDLLFLAFLAPTLPASFFHSPVRRARVWGWVSQVLHTTQATLPPKPAPAISNTSPQKSPPPHTAPPPHPAPTASGLPYTLLASSERGGPASLWSCSGAQHQQMREHKGPVSSLPPLRQLCRDTGVHSLSLCPCFFFHP